MVVADQRMPGMTGVQLFERMCREHPHTKRVLLTGYSDSDAMMDAINTGRVFHFLTKPWERHVLLSVLMRALEAHQLSITNMHLTDQLLISQRCVTLGQMAAQIAHEIGNNICVLPLLDLIQEKYSDCPDLVEMSSIAGETHEKLVTLIEEIKSFVRFEQNQMERRPTDLGRLSRELAAFLRFDKAFPQDKIQLHVNAHPVVMGNKFKLQQVLVNLLKNAADAIRNRDDGVIHIEVDAYPETAVLRVIDNGVGMSEEVLDRIWQPFFTTKGDQGNGLGLVICRQLIDGHEGEIECDSAPGKGTTFTIRLPVVPGACPAPPDQLEATPEATGSC